MSHHIVNTDGAAIQVVESGAGEPALVFLHYWGGPSRTWRHVVGRLGGNPRTLAVDLRDWGGSVATDGRYDLVAMADDAASRHKNGASARGGEASIIYACLDADVIVAGFEMRPFDFVPAVACASAIGGRLCKLNDVGAVGSQFLIVYSAATAGCCKSLA